MMLTWFRRKKRGLLPCLLLMMSCALVPRSAHANAPAVPGYADYQAFVKQVASVAGSTWATQRTLAKTRDGREIFLLTLGKGKSLDQRPAVLIVGNVHEPHLAGSELAVRLAQQLVDRAEKGAAKNADAGDKAVHDLLSQRTFYIIARPNPDGSEAFFQQPHFERAGNSRPTDDDRDGDIGEDPFNDLDGDGTITMMRIEDPAGEWFEHPDDPRVLIKADAKKNERGKYRLISEGIDDDHDGEFNEDNSLGVSFNRNFTFKYPYFKPGAGPHQVSEPETRAVADFAFDHANITTVLTFTPQDNLFHTWKPNSNAERQRIKTTLLGKDAPFQDFVANLYRESHGGKDAANASGGEGSFSEWAYFHYGRWSYAAQGWWVPNVKPAEGKEPKEKRGENELNQLRWLDQQKIDGFVKWTRIKHPDFPKQKVEVGGFKPYVLLNPPVDQLDAIAGKHVDFLVKTRELQPKLSMPDVKIESLGEGVFRVKATVSNDGYLPTMPEMGRITGKLQDVQLEVTLPKGAKLITGDQRSQLRVLAGKGGSDERTWLIQSPKGGTLKLRAWSPAIGTVGKSVQLKEGK